MASFHSSGDAANAKLSTAFFTGKIRDSTTKESRKAAESLTILNNQRRNPHNNLLDPRGKRININNIDVGKAKLQVGSTLPGEVLQKISDSITELGDLAMTSAADSGKKGRGPSSSSPFWKNPVEEEVRRDIWRRIELLGKSGKMFEDDRAYVSNESDAVDAEYIVRCADYL